MDIFRFCGLKRWVIDYYKPKKFIYNFFWCYHVKSYELFFIFYFIFYSSGRWAKCWTFGTSYSKPSPPESRHIFSLDTNCPWIILGHQNYLSFRPTELNVASLFNTLKYFSIILQLFCFIFIYSSWFISCYCLYFHFIYFLFIFFLVLLLSMFFFSF